MKSPRVNLVIDRDKAAAVGLNATQIAERALRRASGRSGRRRSTAPTAQYRVLLELDPKYQKQADSLREDRLQDADGRARAARVGRHASRRPSGRRSINHSGQLPAVTISFGLRPASRWAPPSTHVKQVARPAAAADDHDELPGLGQGLPGSRCRTSACCSSSRSASSTSCSACCTRATSTRSRFSPGLPSAGLGALLTLWLFGNELNIYSFVGLIMLIGIVKKNAIMQIDFALEAERKHGKTPTEAIYEGCLIRFRPIMMTTMAALLGALPIALGYGAGGEARRPLGLAVVGGLHRLAADHAVSDAGRLHLHGGDRARRGRFRRRRRETARRDHGCCIPGRLQAGETESR